ncbi:MAG: fibronectin type III domain-containing protein [Steroidobacteraceae bacterium]|jgi:hypothetical protein
MRALLSAAVTLILCGCAKAPPALDSASTEADASGHGVATLSWTAPTRNSDASKITDLAGYYIYYGTSPHHLTQSIRVSNPATTTYSVGNLRSGTTYYFSVVAVTATGIKGGESFTVSKAIP